MSIYTPDGWEMIRYFNTNEDRDEYYIFGSWSGGYLDSDTWRRNSGVSEIKEDDEYYYFYGFSGSVYKCHKEHSHIAAYCTHVLSNMLESTDEASIVDKKYIPELFTITTFEDSE